MRVDIEIPSFAGHGLTVRSVDIVEGLSRPFEVAFTAVTPDADLDFERLLGAEATLHIDKAPLGTRAFSGLVSYVEQIELEPSGLSTYAVRVVPRLWLLSQRRGNRIFQHQTALEMVRALLGEWKIELTARVVEANLARHEVRVQYGETDLELFERLLEEAGISYLFDDQRGDGIAHLVLDDGPERAETRRAAVPARSAPNPTLPLPFVTDVGIAHETRHGSVTVADFDFRRPNYPLVYHAEQSGPGEARLERYGYAPGSAVADVPSAATDTPVADDQSSARADEHQGYGLAERRLQSIREDRRRVELTTNLVDLSPGAVLTVAGAPRPELAADQRLLVVETHIDGKINEPWTVRVAAAFAQSKVRPPERTPWPRVEGLQSAVVIGPGDIHTDEFGRVRVRFHWDREGSAASSDDHHSAWVRVDEGWAGSGFGMISIPRVGQEVVVAFYEGNPDQPVIVGRVYDQANPVPQGLPGALAVSTWRTSSSPSATGAGYHELTFDDTAGRDRFLLRSERDLEKIVVREEVEEVGGNRGTVVGRHLGTTIGTQDATTVGQMHEVRMATVAASNGGDQGAPNVTPLDTRREIIAKRITLTTGGSTIVLDGPNITVTAQHQVRIQAGGTVVIQGEPYVQINPPLVTKKADAAKAPPPGDHLVWLRLVSDGAPIAGARVHVEHADGTTSAPQATDGAGRVRLPVDKPGAYQVKLGDPPKPAPKPAAAPAPAAAAPAHAAAAPAPAAAAPKPVPAAISVGQTPAQPTAKAKPTDHDVPIAVQIVSPAPATVFSIEPGTYPGPAPSMPHVLLKAKVLVQGQESSVGSVRWELTISGKYRVRDHQVDGNYRWQEFKFAAGTARTKPNEELSVLLTPAEIVGGDLEIKASFEGGPDLASVTVVQVLKGLKVVGKDAPRTDVEKFIVDQAGDLAWLFLRMFCHESDHTLAEFQRTQPRYGPPSGVGIAQQDPEEGEWVWPKDRLSTPSNFFPRIFWDWRKNVVSGMDHFNSTKVPTARRQVANLRKANPKLAQPPEGMILRAAIRAYNGGRELAVSDDGEHFVVSPHTIAANVGYVDWVLGDPHGTEAPKHPVPADALARIWPALPVTKR